MSNFPPDFCPYCGTELDVVEAPTAFRCQECDDFVFHNPTPGASVAVMDDDGLLLVEDFRSPGRWKLPSGRVEVGESPREGAVRELHEETGLSVETAELTYFYDSAVEPVSDVHLANTSFVVPRSATSGTLRADSDATDARFFTSAEFAESDHAFTETHVKRFGSDRFDWLFERARTPLEGDPV